MPDEFQRRLPSVEKNIKDINQGDMRLRILGTVIDKKENKIVVDDGTGQLSVVFDEPVNAELNQIIRVFGKVIPNTDGFELQADFYQDMKDVDINLYRKIQKIEGG